MSIKFFSFFFFAIIGCNRIHQCKSRVYAQSNWIKCFKSRKCEKELKQKKQSLSNNLDNNMSIAFILNKKIYIYNYIIILYFKKYYY